MDSIGALIRPQPSGGEFLAAAIVATANDCLRDKLQLSPFDASATSIRDGDLLIETEHGAVAGIIERQAQSLIKDINQVVGRRFHTQDPVRRIVTRRR